MSALWFEWLRRRPEASLRLFCFHYAGGSAHRAHPWAMGLPPEIEVCAVELPGRGKRALEAPYSRIAPLIDDLTAAITPLLAERPFVFFGHSMGALVAFELTRRLRREQLPLPQALVVSAHAGPQLPRQTIIHDLPDAAFWDHVIRLNGTPKDVLHHPELVEFLSTLIRADFAVCETYEYADEPPLALPLIAYGGTDDPGVAPDQLAAWAPHTSAMFEQKVFSGDHFYLHADQAAVREDLLARLQALLAPVAR